MKKSLLIKPILMVFLLVVSLSTATFAWFSVSTTASVDEMQMQAAASGDLGIVAGNYSAITDYSATSNLAAFEYQNWDGSEISGDGVTFFAEDETSNRTDTTTPSAYRTAEVINSTDAGEYFEQTFTIYQQTSTKQTQYVYLNETAFAYASGTTPTYVGSSYDETSSTDVPTTEDCKLYDAYRVSITCDETTTVYSNTGDATNIITKTDGTNTTSSLTALSDLTKATATAVTSSNDEGYVGCFETTAYQYTEADTDYYDEDDVYDGYRGYLTFTVRIWLEGTDDNCILNHLTDDEVYISLPFQAYTKQYLASTT